MRNAIIDLMQDLYFDGDGARAILIRIGFRPAQIPEFRSAETFWPPVVLRLEQGIVRDGIKELLLAAERDHPGKEEIEHLLRGLGERPRPNPAPGPVRVLCLFADPVRESKIRLDKEARLLQEIAERGGIELLIRHAVRVTDIIGSIHRTRPQIIHFSGHGGQNGQLVFEGTDGAPAPVNAKLFADASATTGDKLDCVVLNSCFTADNANAFRDAARAVAGSVTSISDTCALAFTRGFYNAVAEGATVRNANASGRAEMNLEGCDTSGMHFVTFA